MIQRVKIVESDIEKLFDKIVPDWKNQTLYQWQYGGEHPEGMATSNLYDLKYYKKEQAGRLTLYAKKGGLIVELEDNNFGHTNVLTNVEPSGMIDKEKEPKKIAIDELRILF